MLGVFVTGSTSGCFFPHTHTKPVPRELECRHSATPIHPLPSHLGERGDGGWREQIKDHS